MTPIVKSPPSYIKDCNHALEIFGNFIFSGQDNIIFSMDITSLYTVIRPNATSSSKEELNLFINSVNSFHPALKYTWEISENSLAFPDIKLSINDQGLSTPLAYTTNQLILITTCYIRPLIHNTLKMPSHSLNFSDRNASAVTTRTLTNARKCASFSKNAATLTSP